MPLARYALECGSIAEEMKYELREEKFQTILFGVTHASLRDLAQFRMDHIDDLDAFVVLAPAARARFLKKHPVDIQFWFLWLEFR